MVLLAIQTDDPDGAMPPGTTLVLTMGEAAVPPDAISAMEPCTVVDEGMLPVNQTLKLGSIATNAGACHCGLRPQD